MKKQQLLLVGGGFLLLIILFFFVPTTPKKSAGVDPGQMHTHSNDSVAIDFPQILAAAKQSLQPQQVEHLVRLENSVGRGDVNEQTLHAYHQLARYWGDSLKVFLPFAYYTAQAAKLENSEKNLTFAANLYLANLQVQKNSQLKNWMAREASELFEKALILNPDNDSLKVGLGSCYIFGNLSSNPMEGIMRIREVAERDPENTYAQFMLGVGGVISGQFDRAAERFIRVINKEPENLEAILRLAEVYELTNKNDSAVIWYRKSQELISNPDFKMAVEERIKSLK
ncbi:MAG TPA: tetratricopeptide repeat protein [Parasegetibacter sp.]